MALTLIFCSVSNPRLPSSSPGPPGSDPAIREEWKFSPNPAMVQLYHHLSRKAKAQQSLRESSASVDSSQREFSPLAKMEGTPYAAQTQALHFSAVHNLRDSDDSRSSPLPRDTGFPNRREDDRASIGSSTPSSQSSLSRRDKCARCKKPAIGFDAFVGCSTCLRMYHESCTQNDTSIHEEDW